MGFGHIFVQTAAERVADAVDRHVREKGLERFECTADVHPKTMKTIAETNMRLLWISPRIRNWTGIHEYRYYNNEARERWGYADEHLAAWLSKELDVPVFRLEVLDSKGFWLYNRFEEGVEKEGKAFEDPPYNLSPDPDHPRYELNRICEREGFPNIGVSYENIPGPMVAQIENCHFWGDEIEGHEEFVHRAYRRPES